LEVAATLSRVQGSQSARHPEALKILDSGSPPAFAGVAPNDIDYARTAGTSSCDEKLKTQHCDEFFLVEPDHRLAVDDGDRSRLEPEIEQFF
jgi:hypothetical protein